jgi:hypothetical protein
MSKASRNIVFVAVASVAVLFSLARADAPARAPRLRIGTYDSRAVAVAYAGSDLMRQRLQQLMKDRDAARAAGDQQKVKQLEDQGAALQRKLHRQGFSDVPVDDLLENVKDSLPKVAKDANVAMIVRHVNFTDDAAVEVVDVTDRLVEQFNPSDKTRKMAADIRTRAPADLDEIDKMHNH